MKDLKFPFYAKVKHKITGITGSVTGFLVYANGCQQYEVKFLGKDKDEIKGYWLDEQSLELVSEPSEKPAPNQGNPGGPSRGPSPRRGPSTH